MDVAVAAWATLTMRMLYSCHLGSATNDVRKLGSRHHAILNRVGWDSAVRRADGHFLALPKRNGARPADEACKHLAGAEPACRTR